MVHAMTAPVERLSIKVSQQNHAQIHDMAARMGTSADGVISALLGPGTVRIPVSAVEHERWTSAAQAAGLAVDEWVKLRVEAALTLGSDPGMFARNLERVGRNVDIIARAVGVAPPGGGQASTPRPPVSTSRPPRGPGGPPFYPAGGQQETSPE